MAQMVAEGMALIFLNSSIYQMVRYIFFRYNDEFIINVLYNMCWAVSWTAIDQRNFIIVSGYKIKILLVRGNDVIIMKGHKR